MRKLSANDAEPRDDDTGTALASDWDEAEAAEVRQQGLRGVRQQAQPAFVNLVFGRERQGASVRAVDA